jgi:hypothetical protein
MTNIPDRPAAFPDRPAVPSLTSERLVLEPLRVDHAEEMARLLDDPDRHNFREVVPSQPHDRHNFREVVTITPLCR